MKKSEILKARAKEYLQGLFFIPEGFSLNGIDEFVDLIVEASVEKVAERLDEFLVHDDEPYERTEVCLLTDKKTE